LAIHALAVHALSKTFGAKRAVEDATFAVTRGEITGFLGPNGAGKTTVMNMIVGLTEPDAGEIELLGVRRGNRRRELRMLVGYLQEKPRIYPEMTARGYLRFFADLYGIVDSGSRVGEVIERVGLASAADRRLGNFSRGMQQRACLARVMLHRPELLILDEPTLGLDPNGIADMRAIFREMKAEGVTLLFSSHQLAEMERVCDSVVFMRRGRVLAAGRPAELLPPGVSTGSLAVELYEPAAHCLEHIAGLPEVEHVRQTAPHRVELVLGGRTACGRDARAQAARLFLRAGYTVLAIDAAAPSLEDVFISLTRPENPVRQEPAGLVH
jgi:ABC-type multidrug transport system ATPase subunit